MDFKRTKVCANCAKRQLELVTNDAGVTERQLLCHARPPTPVPLLVYQPIENPGPGDQIAKAVILGAFAMFPIVKPDNWCAEHEPLAAMMRAPAGISTGPLPPGTAADLPTGSGGRPEFSLETDPAALAALVQGNAGDPPAPAA